MTVILASIQKKSKTNPFEEQTAEYIGRAGRYCACEARSFTSESDFFGWVEKNGGRSPIRIILLDSLGALWTSEEFAEQIERLRDDGAQILVLALGPADGWSREARENYRTKFSLGRVTLPHQLARVVLAEQVYRALTILAGHPYHCGH